MTVRRSSIAGMSKVSLNSDLSGNARTSRILPEGRAALLVGLLVCVLGLLGIPALADETAVTNDQAVSMEPKSEYIEVTATRMPEPVDTVPASISVVTGEDLRARGARDLHEALRLLAGIDIAQGGDGGPAGSVPEFWGLKELDAFLLVVDGVPWGGAFNPALSTIDLNDVEKIEVLRGPAPVMYGATSFVGVIQIIRRAPGAGDSAARLHGGSYGSYGGGLTFVLEPGDMRTDTTSTISADAETLGYRDNRTQVDRAHLLWRNSFPAWSGRFRLDFEGFWVNQDPQSPVPREGVDLGVGIPLDANHNPDHAKIDQRRLALTGGYELPLGGGEMRWSTTLSAIHSVQQTLRGFLTDVSNTDPNANGFRQNVYTNDVYFDTHIEADAGRLFHWVAGVDHLFGSGRGDGGDFDYFVDLKGNHPPDGEDIAFGGVGRIRDTRNFSGAYGQVEWRPWDFLRFDAGARLNHTDEDRKTFAEEVGGPGPETGKDNRKVTRGSGGAGVTWTAWHEGEDSVHVYGSYRNTYKPAATDFGLDSEAEILGPETATSYETGVKGRFFDGTLDVELSAFQMNFNNLVVASEEAGNPVLENAGKSRLQGIETELDWRVRPDLYWRTTYSLHDARFRDFVTDFDGVPTQLQGNKLETTARYMAATGVVWSPARGWRGSIESNWVGRRFLNKRNTAIAKDYITWGAGVGYRWDTFELRVDGTNLNDQRPPVSESELGESQYYLLSERRVTVTGNWRY